MLKTSSWLFSFVLLGFVANAQTGVSGKEEDFIRKNTSVIRKSVGVFNGSYFLYERDYGRLMDFNNNMRANIKRFDANTLERKDIVDLNPAVAETGNEDAVMFTDIIPWGSKILGFYTNRSAAGKSMFPCFARFFDADLKPIGEKIDLGDFPRLTSDRFAMQSGFVTVSLANEFHYRISPDSSKILLFYVEKSGGSGNVSYKIFDRNLRPVDEVGSASIPVLADKGARVADYRVDNGGNVYVLVSVAKSKAERKEEEGEDDKNVSLYRIGAKSKGEIKSIEINLSGQAMVHPVMAVNNRDNPVVFGMFHSVKEGKSSSAEGIFSIKVDGRTFKPSPPEYKNFDPELLSKFMSDRQVRKANNGYSEMPFPLSNITLLPDGGIFAWGQVEKTILHEQGRTGAMNYRTSYSGNLMYCYLNPDGNISWIDGEPVSAETYESMTKFSGIASFFREGKIYVGFAGNGQERKKLKGGIDFTVYGQKGKLSSFFVALDKDLDDYTLIPNTIQKTAPNSYVMAVYKMPRILGGGQKFALFKLNL